jgi:hypothetical protein
VAEERAAWRAEVASGRLDPGELIFVDESGIDTRMTRRFARARRGERARGAVPSAAGAASPWSARSGSAGWSRR